MPSAEFIEFATAVARRRPTFGTRCPGALIVSALAFVSLLLLAAPLASAQGVSGATLRGVVKDPQGAVVRDAAVTLTNTQRGDQRQVKTSDEGAYVFTSVDPGTYTLKVE